MSDVAVRNPGVELVQTMRGDVFRKQVALALPDNVTPDRFVRIAITALQANPDIVACDHETIIRELITCAQMGLLPDGNEAALVGFKGKAKLMPMIAGYRRIAAEYGWTIRTAVVHEHDEFDYSLGLDAELTHRRAKLGTDRGPKVATYAVGAHRDGRREFEVMDATEVEKVRQTSRAKDSGPWKDWPERMWEKTVGRRLFKKLPLDPNDRRVSRMVEHNDFEDPIAAVYGPRQQPRELIEGEIPDGAEPPAVGGSQQATGVSASPPAPVAPGDESAAPGDLTDAPTGVQEPGAADDEPQVSFPIPGTVEVVPPTREEIAAALDLVIPKGTNAGQKLRDVLAAEEGKKWMEFALSRKPSYWTDDFRAALELIERTYGEPS